MEGLATARVAFGLAVLDKPEGMTSNALVSRVRAVAGNKKAGHTGTLDPFATGVMIVGVGKATRLFPYLVGQHKRYHAVLKLGQRTDTADRTGEVCETGPVPTPGEVDIDRVAQELTGRRFQTPPRYSAKKVAGARSYALARAGHEVALAPVEIEVTKLSAGWLASEDGSLLEFEVECSRGTYVRTLGEEIAAGLGTVGHLTQLRRTYSDGYDVSEALALEDFTLAGFLPLGRALAPFAIGFIGSAVHAAALHGHPVNLSDVSDLEGAGEHVALFGCAPAGRDSLDVEALVGLYSRQGDALVANAVLG